MQITAFGCFLSESCLTALHQTRSYAPPRETARKRPLPRLVKDHTQPTMPGDQAGAFAYEGSALRAGQIRHAPSNAVFSAALRERVEQEPEQDAMGVHGQPLLRETHDA